MRLPHSCHVFSFTCDAKTTAICLNKDDIKSIWLTYIFTHFNEFKLMPNLRDFGQFSM